MFGLQFLLALIALVTGMVNTAGVELFGSGTLMQMIWLGFSPVVAVVVLHMLFRHALQLPSPFVPFGAFAWAGQMGGTGSAAGGGPPPAPPVGLIGDHQLGFWRPLMLLLP